MIRDGKTGGAPQGSGSFVHAQAVSEAQIAAVDQGRIGARYFLATTDAPFLDLFHHAETLLGRVPRLKPAPAVLVSALGWISQGISLFTRKAPDLTPDVARIMNSVCLYSGAVAKAELGLKPMAVEEMMRDSYDWLKGEGLIPYSPHYRRTAHRASRSHIRTIQEVAAEFRIPRIEALHRQEDLRP